MKQIYIFVFIVAPIPRPPRPSEKTYVTILPDGSVSPEQHLPCWMDYRGAGRQQEAEVFISIVVPAYNEEKRLGGMLEEAVDYLQQHSCMHEGSTTATTQGGKEVQRTSKGRRRQNGTAGNLPPPAARKGWEILIVSDGSTDRTIETALSFARSHQLFLHPTPIPGPRTPHPDHSTQIPPGAIRIISLEENRGKGGAVVHGMRHVRGEYVIFADADGASKFSDLGRLMEECQRVEDSQGRGVAVGSRAHLVGSEAVVKRSFLRNFLMHSFHLLLRILTPTATAAIKDTQCGFKLFSRPCLPHIIPFMHSEGWIFDVEMLMLAESAGIPVTEVPVGWKEVGGSKLNVIWDSLGMAWGLAVLRAAWPPWTQQARRADEDASSLAIERYLRQWECLSVKDWGLLDGLAAGLVLATLWFYYPAAFQRARTGRLARYLMMASKSPPLAFLPSLAVSPPPIASNENYPPLSPLQTTLPEMATSPPLRPSISTQAGFRRTPDALTHGGHLSSLVFPNHQSPAKSFSGSNSHQSFASSISSPRLAAASSNVIPASFVDQSRAFVEQQRHVFEQERLLFAQERELWETERNALYERIKQLESTVESNNGGSGRKISELARMRPSVESVSMLGQLGHRGTFGNVGSSGAIRRQLSQSDTGEKFWEGSSRNSSATRTFSPPPRLDDGRLPSILESGSIGLSKTSRRSGLRSREGSENTKSDDNGNIAGNSADISLIRKDLDGINIKASALPSAAVAQLRSPESPGISTPASSHGLSPGGLSSLIKHAGHTPPAPARYSIGDSEQSTPKQYERLHRPSMAIPLPDNLLPSDSPADADPALGSPLGITDNNEKNAAFLDQLNSKLLQEARKVVYSSPETLSEDEDSNAGETESNRSQSEPEVRMRFRRSMNFGSALGSAECGAR